MSRIKVIIAMFFFEIFYCYEFKSRVINQMWTRVFLRVASYVRILKRPEFIIYYYSQLLFAYYYRYSIWYLCIYNIIGIKISTIYLGIFFNIIIIFILKFQSIISIIINNDLATLLYNAGDHIIIWLSIIYILVFVYNR